MRKIGFTFFIVISFLLVPLAAQATMILGFYNISANNVTNAATGETQLSVTVSPFGAQAKFLFSNSGPIACSIADVYFDDGSLLGIASIINGPGVNFSQGASPPNLPAGNNATPPFETTAGFLADSDAPVQPNGVNPGEILEIIFDLQGTQTIDDVYDELETGALRIGIHVQGFPNGGSESFINNSPNSNPGSNPIVPEPGTLLLLGSGLAGLVGYGKIRIGRKKK